MPRPLPADATTAGYSRKHSCSGLIISSEFSDSSSSSNSSSSSSEEEEYDPKAIGEEDAVFIRKIKLLIFIISFCEGKLKP